MQRNNTKVRPYLSLHFLILIFGFTGILGKYIDTPSTALVIYRTGLTFIALGIYMRYKGVSFSVGRKNLVLLLLSGGVIGLHWVLFFAAIKTSNVSVTMAMLATGALFASLLEPIFYHRRLRLHEVLLGLVAVCGIYVIYSGAEHADFKSGIIIALCASFLSACYSIINSKWSEKLPDGAVSVAFYEMIGSVVVVAVLFAPSEGFLQGFACVDFKDALGILFLAVVCTAYTSVRMIQLFKYLSPFTMMLNINLEPVYSMIMAVLIFPDTERMSGRFYIGAAVILSTVVLNALLNNYRDRRRAKRLASTAVEA